MYARIYTYVRKCISYKALTHTATYYNSWYVVGIIKPKNHEKFIMHKYKPKVCIVFFLII